MPAPDGIELARIIRSSKVNASSVIVMITGEEDRTVMTRAYQAGVEFFLFKPVDRGKLIKLIRVTEGTIERERRRFMRVRARCKVAIQSNQDHLEGATLDLSMEGILVQASRALPVGTSVTLKIELERGVAPLNVAAHVVRVIGVDCMGIQLEKLESAESERLQKFLLPLILRAKD